MKYIHTQYHMDRYNRKNIYIKIGELVPWIVNDIRRDPRETFGKERI